MMRRIFKDPALNLAYDAQGYVVIRNFYAPDDVLGIRRVYEARFSDIERRPGMWCTQVARYGSQYDQRVIEDRAALDEALNGATLPKMDRYFDAVRLLSGVIMDKFPGDDTSECVAHRDWTMVDESKHEGWLIWSPLTSITGDHGLVYVLPGSHKEEFHGIQAAITPWPYRQWTPIIKKYSRELTLSPGDVLVYSNRAIHGSPPNRTTNNRPVITMGGCDKDAPLWYCWHDRNDPTTATEIYEIANDDQDFFYRHNHVDRPSGVKFVGTRPAGFPDYDARSFEAMCERVAARADETIRATPG
jgi:ectoine hydroxylase-related dioxygenase (phytanoyl-CoA dioxygenase family)